MEIKNGADFRFDMDDDESGELFVQAFSGNFCGLGSAWFNKGQLIDFAQKLCQMPLPIEPEIKLIGGFWDSEEKPEPIQPHVKLHVYPIGKTGDIGIRIFLATPVQATDRAESQQLVSVELKTTYQGLAEFANDLTSLAQGDLKDVELIAR